MKRKPLLFLLLMAMFMPLAMFGQFMANPSLSLSKMDQNTRNPIVTDGWYYYDNGTYGTSVGLGGGSFDWGVMFPAGSYDGNVITEVSVYDVKAMTGTLTIYNDNTSTPSNAISTIGVTLTGAREFVSFEFSNLAVDPSKNVWVVFTNVSGTDYPAAASTDVTNDPNGRWVTIGGTWYDVASVGVPGYSWMIRCHIVNEDPNACPKPVRFAATNITTSSATLSWACDARSFQLVYSTIAGFDPDSATPIDVSDNSYVLDHLADATTYYAYVRTDCEGTYSAWSSLLTFTTVSVCAPPYDLAASHITAHNANISWEGWQDSYTLRYATPVFVEDFENGLDDWTIYTEGEAGGDDGWNTTNPENSLDIPAVSGNYVASSWSWSTNPYHANNWLVSPRVPFGGALCFYVRTNPGYPDSYEVLLSTGGNATTDFTVTLQPMAPAPSNSEWNLVVLDLTAYTGQGYIAIHHVDYDMNYLLIDDFIVTGTFTPITNASSPYPLGGLTEETTYLLQVQGNCPGGTTDWSSIVFATTTLCPPPLNLQVTDITSDRALVTWESEASSFEIDVNGEVTSGVSSPYALGHLESYTSYTVKVRSTCGETGNSNWVETSFVTECGTYDLPYGYDFNDVVLTDTPDIDCWFTYSFNDENEIGLTWIDQESGDIALYFTSENRIEEDELYYQLLVSPELNTDAAVNVQFAYISYSGEGESFAVGCCSASDYNGLSDFDWNFFITTQDTDWNWFEGIFPAGTKYVAVLYLSENMADLIVDDFSFETAKVFITDGDWDDPNNWSPVGVPTGESVVIDANATIPGDCIAEANEILMGEDGSITIEDGGQLYQTTDELEVTVKKNVAAYTGATDNYQLLAFPFYGLGVPEDMTTAEGYDLYKFDNSQPGEEWQNNKQVEIQDIYMNEGFLYANPEDIELSLTGNLKPSNMYTSEGYLNYEYNYLYYDGSENEVNGWYLLGNPFIVDAYIYKIIFDEDGYVDEVIPMVAMYYDENGDMQTIEAGPIPPMQGFFVSIAEDEEDVEAYVFTFEWSDAKSMPSLKNFKKRNRNEITVPVENLPSIDFGKPVKAMSVKVMDAVTMPKKK